MNIGVKKKAYILYLLAAALSFWYWHVDEHYQIFEFASYKLGITPRENLPWEFFSEMRSGILPSLAFLVSKYFITIHLFHPFVVEAILRVLSASFFIYVYFRLIDFFEIGNDTFLSKMILFFWILPTVMVRYSAESISCSLFWLGFVVHDFRKSQTSRYQNIFVGLAWGLAFYVRMQIAILIGTYFIWMCVYQRRRLMDFFEIGVGFVLSTVIELLANHWLYGHLVWSPYAYFKENMIYDKASHFGIQPFHYYVTEVLKNFIYVLGIPVWIGVVYYSFKQRYSLFVWLLLSFILVHSMIGHKEYRFLFPVFPILISLGWIGFVGLLDVYKMNKGVALKVLWIVNVLLIPTCFMIQSFSPWNYLMMYSTTKNHRVIYSDIPCPYALNNEFYTVRPYYWKDKDCTIIEKPLDSMQDLKQGDIVITSVDYGLSFTKNGCVFQNRFQTITPEWNKKLPQSLKETINYMYMYEVVNVLSK